VTDGRPPPAAGANPKEADETLTADRVGGHATRLGLTHLTNTITVLVDRPKPPRWITSTSSTSSKKQSDSA
jgi:hypothetical protein